MSQHRAWELCSITQPSLTLPACPMQRRLLAHKGDLVCGMDFHVDVREGWDRHWRNIPAAEVMPYGPYGPQLGVSHSIQNMQAASMYLCTDSVL